MIREAIDKIASMAQGRIFEMPGGRKFTDMNLHPITEAVPNALSISTLAGLVDYIDCVINNDEEESGALIHIENEVRVDVCSHLMPLYQQRKHFITAVHDKTQDFVFGRWMDLENFIIHVNSQFIQEDNAAAILRLVGNIKDGQVKTHQDDGVSQTVNARVGITRVEPIAVPSPVTLVPFRTFSEIDQPPSQFIFRMKSGEETPSCALFEADGGAWKVTAIESIKTWLEAQLEGVTVIA